MLRMTGIAIAVLYSCESRKNVLLNSLGAKSFLEIHHGPSIVKNNVGTFHFLSLRKTTYRPYKLGGGNSNIFLFSPLLGGDPHFD